LGGKVNTNNQLERNERDPELTHNGKFPPRKRNDQKITLID